MHINDVVEELRTRSVLWYPCAGSDYSPLLYFHPDEAASRGIERVPDIYVFNDYVPSAFCRPEDDGSLRRLIELREPLCVFDNDRTRVEVVDRTSVDFGQATSNVVDRMYAAFPELALERATAFRLRLRVSSERLGVYSVRAYYFFMETTVLLRDLFVAHDLRVSHLFHVRDGAGFGGGAGLGFGWLYNLVPHLGTRTLISDADESIVHSFARGRGFEKALHTVLEREAALREFADSQSSLFTARQCCSWNEPGDGPLHVRVFEVEPRPRQS